MSESFTERISLPRDKSGAAHFVILILVLTLVLIAATDFYCAALKRKDILVIGLPVRAEDTLMMMNEDKVNDIIRIWVSQHYFITVVQFRESDSISSFIMMPQAMTFK